VPRGYLAIIIASLNQQSLPLTEAFSFAIPSLSFFYPQLLPSTSSERIEIFGIGFAASLPSPIARLSGTRTELTLWLSDSCLETKSIGRYPESSRGAMIVTFGRNLHLHNGSNVSVTRFWKLNNATQYDVPSSGGTSIIFSGFGFSIFEC